MASFCGRWRTRRISSAGAGVDTTCLVLFIPCYSWVWGDQLSDRNLFSGFLDGRSPGKPLKRFLSAMRLEHLAEAMC